MSRVFVDDQLLTWEVYASGGKHGLPDRPKIIFHCMSDPRIRARFVVHEGDNADAEEEVSALPEEQLREMFRASSELD